MSLLLRAVLEKKEGLAAVGFLARNGSAATMQLGSDMKVYSVVVLHDCGTEMTKNHVRIQSVGQKTPVSTSARRIVEPWQIKSYKSYQTLALKDFRRAGRKTEEGKHGDVRKDGVADSQYRGKSEKIETGEE